MTTFKPMKDQTCPRCHAPILAQLEERTETTFDGSTSTVEVPIGAECRNGHEVELTYDSTW